MKKFKQLSSISVVGHSGWKIAALATALFSLSSCMAGQQLRTSEALPPEIQGSYTLMLYGCSYPDDIENAAILAKEGTPYRFAIYAPSFEYKVKSGLSAEEALKEAQRFVQCGFFYQQSRLSAIQGPAGSAIGYELRPLYSPIRFGEDDVLDIRYALNGEHVVVYITLKPEIENIIQRQGGGNDRDRR